MLYQVKLMVLQDNIMLKMHSPYSKNCDKIPNFIFNQLTTYIRKRRQFDTDIHIHCRMLVYYIRSLLIKYIICHTLHRHLYMYYKDLPVAANSEYCVRCIRKRLSLTQLRSSLCISNRQGYRSLYASNRNLIWCLHN